jgi:hypothetical protein
MKIRLKLEVAKYIIGNSKYHRSPKGNLIIEIQTSIAYIIVERYELRRWRRWQLLRGQRGSEFASIYMACVSMPGRGFTSQTPSASRPLMCRQKSVRPAPKESSKDASSHCNKKQSKTKLQYPWNKAILFIVKWSS